MQYALINNNLVENVAEADQAWADSVASDWQAVVNITLSLIHISEPTRPY